MSPVFEEQYSDRYSCFPILLQLATAHLLSLSKAVEFPVYWVSWIHMSMVRKGKPVHSAAAESHHREIHSTFNEHEPNPMEKLRSCIGWEGKPYSTTETLEIMFTDT